MREIVLVHGLWHGAWCWDDIVPALQARGVPVRALDLPMRTLDEDTAVVRAALDDATANSADSVVLVGHSYGGAVITAAGDHPAVARLVYLAAFALDAGESISRVAYDEFGRDDTGAAAFVVGDTDGGTDVSMDPDAGPPLMYHRSPPGAASRAVARSRPVGRALFSARPAAVAWRERPATYVVCGDDRMVAPGLQQIMARRCATSLEWDCDHSPQSSRPDELVALLAGLARSPGR